ncbi:MAG: SUMF1/EgtB/PvdO family nonheme iron enzyme [Candidatus Poribacteria bacterium]
MNAPVVFISYSHDSQEHKDRVLALSNKLIDEGLDCILDQYEMSPPEGWPKWMDRCIEDSNFILIVCTETYYRRVMDKEEPGKGLGVKWESTLTYNHLYHADSKNIRFIPIVFDTKDEKYIPTPLQGFTYYCVNTEEGYDGLYRHLTDQKLVPKPERGKLRERPPKPRKDDFLKAKIDELQKISLEKERQDREAKEKERLEKEQKVLEAKEKERLEKEQKGFEAKDKATQQDQTKDISIIGADGAEMVLIPAGEFQMGSNDGENDEKPVHAVYLNAFYMDKYEVTNTQYGKFMKESKHEAPKYWNDSSFNTPNHPVVGVSWNDAKAYAEWAGKRLPTEAEWEKAARGGLVGKLYPWGDTLTHDDANYNGTGGKDIWKYTSPVGSFAPNGYGLYDMAGNVWEWCADWYDSNYYSNSPKSNPAGPSSGELRVLRGGSWSDNLVNALRVAFRYYVNPLYYSSIGFRCVQ